MRVGIAAGSGSGGATAYGFEIPQGSPGELAGAAQSCADWSSALSARAAAVRAGASAATSQWSGTAESGFASFAAHVVDVYQSLGGVVADGGRALGAFSRELEMAQRITTQALSECESLSQQVSTYQGEAATHAQTVQTLTPQLAAAVHPPQQQALSRQLSAAQSQQDAATRAASAAQDQLQAAERRGRQAWADYQHQAEATSRVLQGLTAQVQKVELLPAAAGVAGGAAAGGIGFWPVLTPAGQTGAGATIGLAEGIVSRYRNTDLLLPISKQGTKAFQALSGELTGGDSATQLGSGLWVPKGSSADPLLQQVQSIAQSDGVNTPGEGFLVAGKTDLGAIAPTWARFGGRALGVAGAGLELYSVGADQWNYDAVHHPGWSTAAKVADTAQTTAVVGGFSVGGAMVGAEVGAEGGAAAGAAVGSVVPVVGTTAGGVVGGVVGGVAGGIAGSGLGQAVGHAAEDLGHGIASGVSDAWNAVFG